MLGLVSGLASASELALALGSGLVLVLVLVSGLAPVPELPPQHRPVRAGQPTLKLNRCYQLRLIVFSFPR